MPAPNVSQHLTLQQSEPRCKPMDDSLRADVKARMPYASLARSLGVSRQVVSEWFKSRVPAERVLDVEKATGIPRHRFRPDLYPEDGPPSARANRELAS